MATRPKPHIDLGSITKRRDRESFKNFVLEVIDDTFIFEVIPTSISLNGELFTLVLGPVDNSNPPDGDYDDPQYDEGVYVQDVKDIKGYRFVYEDLVVADSKDYLDVYLYGVKQIDNYNVTFDDTSITITFTEGITRIPADVVSDFNDGKNSFEIKGKITEIV
jgi:hypothetical protein